VNPRRSSQELSGHSIEKLNSTQDREILSEKAFHRVVSLERRRTERSGKPFVLMLLDMGGRLPSDAARRHLLESLLALAASIRETDVAGWYKTGTVVGVTFTELGLEERETIVKTITARVAEILRSNLPAELFPHVTVSFHMFPEDHNKPADHNKEVSQGPTNPLYPDLSKRADARRVSGAMKRMMDILGSASALVLAAPLFLVIAAAIKVTSKGPVFFRQRRIGQQGKPFIFLKFRSMRVGNNANVHKEYVKQLIAGTAQRNPSNGNDEGVFKLTEDSRITRIGQFLRRTSLDELPQFINVLQGEMSLVGPRPPIPYEVEAYDLWHRRRLLEAKPGITGLWQVSGRSRVTFDEMVRLDLQYARSWTPWLDIKILLRTPAAVLLGDGAH